MSGLHPRPERVAPFHHVIAITTITTITTGQWSEQLAAGGVIVVITGGAARCPVMNIITPWGDIPGIRRDGHLLLEVEMYLQKGCIMLSGDIKGMK